MADGGEDRAVRTGTAAAPDPTGPTPVAPPVVPPEMADAAPTAARVRPAAGLDRQPGEVVLGRYVLVRILGRGGAGTVWMAEDQSLGRIVALKCLPQDGDRALGEARAAARLGHPTVVGTYGIAGAEGCTWLVTEFVAGDTLRRTIRDDLHTDDELLQIGVALCVALRHAHAHGIVHRDVTPRNVLVPVDAFPRATAVDGAPCACHPHVPPAKLADFGIARPTELHEEARAGRIVGTLSYMAPERLAGGEGDEHGDLWALSVVLHEAFVGEHPAGRPERAGALVRAHAHVPSLAPRRPDLPAGVVAAIDRAAAEEPSERGTLLDLERALRAGLAARGVPVSPVLREQSTRDSVAIAPREPARAPLGPAVPVAAAAASLAAPPLAAAVALALVAAAGAALATAGPSPAARPSSRRLAAGLLLVALAVALAGLVVGPVVGAVAGGAAVVLGPALAGGLAAAAGRCPGPLLAPRSIR